VRLGEPDGLLRPPHGVEDSEELGRGARADGDVVVEVVRAAGVGVGEPREDGLELELALPLLDGRAAPRAVAERDDVAARRPHGPGLGGRLDDEPHGVARRAGAAQGVAQIALVLAPRVAQRAAVGDEQEPALAGRRLRENYYDQHRDDAPAPRGSHHRMPLKSR